MITCNLMGGLGNQLFQIFATISYAMKSRSQFKFLNVDKLGGEGSTTLRYTYWNSFLSRLKPFLLDSLPQNIHVIREKKFTFNELPIYEMVGHDTLIYGYFQSYKYFQENFNTIYRLLNIDTIKGKLLEKVGFTEHQLENTVSLHFRIGDYKAIQNYHPLMTKEYYIRCLNYFKLKYLDTKFTVMYFCEDNDINDVNEIVDCLQKHFKDFDFVRGENKLEDWEQLLLMSCCHHNIIANSSFSWWAAYLNSWDNKTICYPSVWFGPSAPHNTDDLCPLSWTKIIA